MERNEQVGKIYKKFEEMRRIMDDGYVEFNFSEAKERNRTLREFLDDSQKRANGYVPSRNSQDKEPWQANIFTGYTRNKIKAHIASVAKEPPKMVVKATNDQSLLSIERGEVMEHLIRASEYEGDGNPERVIIDEAWQCAINGTYVKYVGYLKTTGKEQTITEYDLSKGIIKVEDGDEVIIEDRIIEVEVPLSQFFIGDPYTREVQKQPRLIWASYYTQEEFDAEFGKYKNAGKVKESGYKFTQGEQELFYGEQWVDRVQAGKIEVIKYYSIQENKYCIIANGVMLLDTVMLWGKRKKKYPFAKTIYENFANSLFFWGNSLPNILMGDQDVANAFINSMIDKTYRTLETPLLVGVVNKDALDLEDEYVTGDSKIYVPDINQVKPMPLPSISSGEMQMLQLITRGMDQASTDALQGGFGGSGSTAREIVIANEKAEELKGLFFSSLKDFYVQKYRLRVLNILANYNRKDRITTIEGKDGEDTFYKIFSIKSALSSGEQGTLQVAVTNQGTINKMVRPVGKTKEGKEFNELDVMQEQARLKGQPLEIIMINSDYLDDWEYEIEINSESFYQKSRALDKAMLLEKIEYISKLFPDIFQANKSEFLRDLLKTYGDSADKYLANIPEPAMPGMPGAEGMPPSGGELSAQLLKPTEQMRSLGVLAGA